MRKKTFKCGKDAYQGGKDNDIVPFKQREEVIITPDVEYNAYLNTLPDNQRFTPNDAYDSYYYWQLNGKPKDFVEAYNKGMFTYDNSDGMYHANSVAFDDNDNGHFMKPKTHDTVGYELDWYNNGIITEEGGKQRQAKGKEKREWQKFKKEYELVDDPDRPNFYMYRKRSLKKPKFAPGKDDDDIIFGEVPYPLYDQYGNLLDLNTGAIGTTALPNVEVVANPEDVARGNNRRAEEMAKKWYKDFGIESNDAISTPLTTNHHLKQRSEEGAAKAAAWAKDHPYLNTTGLAAGAVPFAVAAYPGAVVGGELLGTALANPYVDAGLTSVFAAHGLNHWLNEGITDWKDGVMTALEVAPLGRLVGPLYDFGKATTSAGINYADNYYKGFKNVRKSQKYISDIEKEYENAISKITSKYKDGQGISGDNLKRMGELYSEYMFKLYGENADIRGLSYFAKDKSTVSKIRRKINRDEEGVFNSPEEVIRQSVEDFNSIRPGHTAALVENGALSKDSYPLLSSMARRRMMKGEGDIIPVIDNGVYRMIKLNKYGRNKKSISNIDKNIQELREATGDSNIPDRFSVFGNHYVPAFIFKKSPLQITAENAASMTSEQWTAAQDAAIARGDMAEAQRLRDLHFKVSAPNTVASVNGQPLQLYHGTDATFNAFDISKYGNTDGGTFGRGLYTTPVKEYAELYGKNNMPLYMKLDNPRDYRNSSIGDLIAEKIAFGDDFATGIGIDGAIGRPSWKGFKGLEEYVSHNPKNIKSSLPITYDDNGVRIPLGMRDNFKINDIRYGLLPFLGLGMAENLNKPHHASGKDSGIHIKPENRGKFTRLKKRTGKSASWFKAHGTPAQKKMATFALNARKWKHK